MTYEDQEVDATLLAGGDAGADPVEQVTHLLSFSTATLGVQRMTIGEAKVVIGRARPADLVVESSKVSRQHCTVQVVKGMLTLADLGSTNGTFVDGRRIAKPARLNHGAVITVGGETLTYERLSERDVAAAQAAERDLQSASSYVQMLLPKPLVTEGVQADWLFMPCAQLGGSGFGYRFLTPSLFCGFMIEVAGRGTQTAMHSVAVMNLLRQAAIAGVDFTRPDSVLAGLSRAFPTEQNGGLFFSACYFTFDLDSRTIRYAAAGRSPAYLADPALGAATTFESSGGPIGLRADETAAVTTCQVKPGMRMVLVSDGVCERLQTGSIDHMHALVVAPSEPTIPEPLRLHQTVRELTGEAVFDEDFVALVFTL